MGVGAGSGVAVGVGFRSGAAVRVESGDTGVAVGRIGAAVARGGSGVGVARASAPQADNAMRTATAAVMMSVPARLERVRMFTSCPPVLPKMLSRPCLGGAGAGRTIPSTPIL